MMKLSVLENRGTGVENPCQHTPALMVAAITIIICCHADRGRCWALFTLQWLITPLMGSPIGRRRLVSNVVHSLGSLGSGMLQLLFDDLHTPLPCSLLCSLWDCSSHFDILLMSSIYLSPYSTSWWLVNHCRGLVCVFSGTQVSRLSCTFGRWCTMNSTDYRTGN